VIIIIVVCCCKQTGLELKQIKHYLVYEQGSPVLKYLKQLRKMIVFNTRTE